LAFLHQLQRMAPEGILKPGPRELCGTCIELMSRNFARDRMKSALG